MVVGWVIIFSGVSTFVSYSLPNLVHTYTHTHIYIDTHTHTHTYIYIYIYPGTEI